MTAKPVATILVPSLLALSLAALSPALAQPAPPPPGNAEQGRKTFTEAGCQTCHGTIGHGGGIAGPKIASPPLPYFLFISQIRKPVRAMPRYSPDLLTDRQAADIYAYLQALPKGSDPDKIAQLRR